MLNLLKFFFNNKKFRSKNKKRERNKAFLEY